MSAIGLYLPLSPANHPVVNELHSMVKKPLLINDYAEGKDIGML